MRTNAVLHILGLLLIFFSNILLIPLLIAACYDDADKALEQNELGGFVLASALSLVTGVVLHRLFKSNGEPLGVKEGFGVVCIAWIVLAFFGALPYYRAGVFSSFVDAYFETMSGLSTTGASVLDDVEALPHGLLFWRHLTHWLGGMGIIVLAVAIFPALGVAGYNLFKVESSVPTFKRLAPRIVDTARLLWEVYVLLTALQVLVLVLGNMNLFEAVCHSFATVATGGFSTRNQSLGAFSPFIQYSTIFFMVLGGINFTLHFHALRGNFRQMFCNPELRFFLGVQFLAATTVILVLYLRNVYGSFEEAFRYGLFQTVAIGTCTGFGTADYEKWPDICRFVLFLLMFIGACAGSTTGAMKCVRVLVMLKSVGRAIRQLLNPRAVIVTKYGDTALDDNTISGMAVFCFLYICVFASATFLLCLFAGESVEKANGIDLLSASGSVASCLGGVGPGFGSTGPSHSYSHLPAIAKCILILCMLLGRLEIFGVLVLFSPSAWRR